MFFGLQDTAPPLSYPFVQACRVYWKYDKKSVRQVAIAPGNIELGQ